MYVWGIKIYNISNESCENKIAGKFLNASYCFINLKNIVVGLFALNKMCDKKCSVSSTIQYNCY